MNCGQSQKILGVNLKETLGNRNFSGVFLFAMAYFSNGSEGSCFDEQCGKCKYGQVACPIAYVQMSYNYDQHNDASGTATKILNDLVSDEGVCAMYELDPEHFFDNPDQIKLEL